MFTTKMKAEKLSHPFAAGCLPSTREVKMTKKDHFIIRFETLKILTRAYHEAAGTLTAALYLSHAIEHIAKRNL